MQVYGEGTHFLIPGIERAITYDVRAQPKIISSDSGSRDLQMVKLGLRVLTKPNPQRLPDLYRRLGIDYSDRVLPSLIHEVTLLCSANDSNFATCGRAKSVPQNIVFTLCDSGAQMGGLSSWYADS